MTKITLQLATLATALGIAGCHSSTSTPTPQPTPAPPVSTAITDQWLGLWTGPEGTSLLLARTGTRYTVKIQSLDGPATYTGTPAGDHIEFIRNGKLETIHAGDGQATGMKWLLDEKNCLVIQKSEGFCRK
jgi:hypothetical protein